MEAGQGDTAQMQVGIATNQRQTTFPACRAFQVLSPVPATDHADGDSASRETAAELEENRSPAITADTSAEYAKHPGDEKNQQYRPQPDTSSAAGTPAGMAVVPSATPKKQYQNDDQYQHCLPSLRMNL
jgi:hypothetical protein